jgi:crotonobetainyl-CoA:carnitine CoA-transferase CaiB-like acyl-CoA transferase
VRQALSGLVVVELADGMAASYCGKLFADLGAYVVKVEPPSGGELRRRAEAGSNENPHRSGSGAFLHLTTNKRSIVVESSTDPGRRRLRRLVERCHLVIEASAGQGCLEEWGVSWDALQARVPAVSVVHISGFGATGPYAGYRWDDLIAQAVSNTFVLQRASDQEPVRLPGHLASYFVGHMAALGGLAAVVRSGDTGCGSFVDCAAVEALATQPARQAPLLAHHYRHGVAPPEQVASTLIPTGVYPCADGYMAMMSTPQQLGEMLDVLDDDNLKAAFARPDAFQRSETQEAVDLAVYTWLSERTRAEATAAAQKAGWPLAGVNSPAEVLAAEHLHQRGFWVHTDDPRVGPIDLPGPWCRFAEGGWAIRSLAPGLGAHQDEIAAALAGPAQDTAVSRLDSRTGTSSAGRPPIAGVRVLDMTAVWAGPYATMLLADLGAEVIRVENPWVLPPTTKGYHPRPVIENLGFLGSMYGPPAPGRPDRPWNRHAMNNSLARNKLSCTIDTRRPVGRELLLRLTEHCDIFIDNFKAGALDRMGIHVSELLARRPGLVVVRLPPAGLTGDWASYTGFGAQFDGLSGLLWLCGQRNSDLTTSPATTYMDAASGPAGAFAAIAALRYCRTTGRGQLVEISQSENVINHLGDIYVDCQLGVEPLRWGNRDPWRAPQGLYRCRGERQWLAISVGDDVTWRALAGVLGQAELADDPRFVDAPSRQAHHDELDKLIDAWAATRPLYPAFHALQQAGVPAGPLLDDDALTADPHFRARQWLQPLDSADVGTHLHPGLAFRGVPHAWWRGSPTLGQDNEYVYKQLLGVSDEEYERYRDDKILAEDYLTPDGNPY